MKKRVLLPLCALLLFLSSCGLPPKTGGPAMFHAVEREGYIAVTWEDREYVPYCNGLSVRDMGEHLGYRADDEAFAYYTLKGHPAEEYIIEYLRSDVPCLLREVNAPSLAEYPPEPDYTWNPPVEGADSQ